MTDDLSTLVAFETQMAEYATLCLKRLAVVEQCPELFEPNEIESIEAAVAALCAFGPCKWW